MHGSCAMWAPSLGLAANKTVTGTRALLEGRTKPCSVCKKEVGTWCYLVHASMYGWRGGAGMQLLYTKHALRSPPSRWSGTPTQWGKTWLLLTN